MGYIIAFVLGIVVATVGVSGVASIIDGGVAKTQQIIKDAQ
jgi:uncharacterized protein GlcG (DUF336 family)